MNDYNVSQLTSMHTQFRVCTCRNGGYNPVNEALCSQQRNIICDVIPTTSYQKNTCHAKRSRRSLQARISYIPNNFVQHQNRKKASLNNHKIIKLYIYKSYFLVFKCSCHIIQIYLQRSENHEKKVFWTTNQAKAFCINYMNESAGYKACLGVPNVYPENAIADCFADIQVSLF